MNDRYYCPACGYNLSEIGPDEEAGTTDGCTNCNWCGVGLSAIIEDKSLSYDEKADIAMGGSYPYTLGNNKEVWCRHCHQKFVIPKYNRNKNSDNVYCPKCGSQNYYYRLGLHWSRKQSRDYYG